MPRVVGVHAAEKIGTRLLTRVYLVPPRNPGIMDIMRETEVCALGTVLLSEINAPQ